MFRLGKQVEYGLIALAHMASLEEDALASSREIAGEYNIPPEILGKVLQALTRAELIQSTQGVKGGYNLARPLADISLGDVVEGIEGPQHMAPCSLEDHVCSQQSHCNIRQQVFRLQARLTHYIYSLPLNSFLSFEAAAISNETLACLRTDLNAATPSLAAKTS